MLGWTETEPHAHSILITSSHARTYATESVAPNFSKLILQYIAILN